MKIKYSQLAKALDHVRYKAGLSNTDASIDISLREEDLQNNRLGECLVVNFIGTYSPDQYDSVKSTISREFNLEVFAEHENRPPRLTFTETRDLEFKKD